MAVDAGTIYSSVRLELDKIRGDIKTLTTEFNTFAKNNQAQADTVEKKWSDSFNQVSLVGVAAFAGITLAIKGNIKTFASLEQSLANVQSVVRETPEEFAKLEEAARAAGETTKFTATEAANALYSLASAGLDATEATAALDGVLKLAGATQSDLAFTSATVTAALSQFGLEASQSTDVANVFAAAIGNSQANITKLANAFRQVGPVSGALGISLEQTTGALQALFDAGFQGEQAGTALRNILSSLANESDPTVKKLNALGIAFEDLNPTVNTTAEIIGNLNDANLDAGQIIAAFGREAGPALLSLLEVGQSGLEDYTEAVTNTTAAADAYDIQMDTLEGTMAELKSAVESVAISFIKEFAPAIRTGIEFVKNIILAINRLPGPLKIFFGVVAAGVPIITGLGAAISALGAITSTAFLPITAIVGAFAALTAGGVALNRVYNKNNFASSELNKANKKLEESTDTLKGSVDRYKDANDKLKKSNEEVNETEITLLESRRKLAGLEVAANLQNTVKALADLEKKSNTNSQAIETYTGKLKTLKNELKANNEENERLTKLQEQGIKFFNTGAGLSRVSTYLQFSQAAIETTVKAIQGTTTALEKSRLAEEQANIERQESIDYLASSLNLGIIQISQIELYNADIAKQVLLRAEQIKKENELSAKREEERKRQETSPAAGKVVEEKEAETQANDELTESIDNANSARLRAQQIGQKVAQQSEAQRKNLQQATDQALKQTRDYELQLLRLVGTEQEVIEAEREIALEAARASGASVAAIAAQEKAINSLYDKLIENANEKLPTWLEENKKYIDAALDSFRTFINSVDTFFKASADNQISEIDRTLQANLAAINARQENELEAAGLLEETKLEGLQRQLADAIEAGDQETSLQLQNEIDRLQISEKYEAERATAKENAERRSSRIEYEAAIASWRIKILSAIADAAAAITGIWAQWAWNPVAAGLLTSGSLLTTGLNIAAIKKSKPEPPAFQTGGIVLPAGSSGRQVTVAENGSPELLLNAGGEGVALLDQFAERIVKAMGSRGAGGVPITILMEMDGRRVAQSSAIYYNNGNVPLRVKL